MTAVSIELIPYVPGEYVVVVPSKASTVPASIVDAYWRDPNANVALLRTILSATGPAQPQGSDRKPTCRGLHPAAESHRSDLSHAVLPVRDFTKRGVRCRRGVRGTTERRRHSACDQCRPRS